MRLWLTRGSELSIREQLVRQVSLAILSQDLKPGQRLPSVRALARRHRIHANTVSAAYHELLDRGWVELRQGSGMYVRNLQEQDKLQSIVQSCLEAARSQGYEPEEVLSRLQQMVRPVTYEAIEVVEPEPALKRVIERELAEHFAIGKGLTVALSKKVQADVRLRLRSVESELKGQPRPPEGTLIAIVSDSQEIRTWARAVLLSVGLAPESICETSTPPRHALVITDSAQNVRGARVFRIIADSSIGELRRLVTPAKASQASL